MYIGLVLGIPSIRYCGEAEIAELWTDVPPEQTLFKYICFILNLFREHWLDDINNYIKYSEDSTKKNKLTFMQEPYVYFSV